MNRRKEVKGIYSTWYECEEHGWTFGEEDERDNCPVCYGESLAEARIIKVLEDEYADISEPKGSMEFSGLYLRGFLSAITLIKGE